MTAEEIFKAIATENGFKKATFDFCPYPDIKTRWTRSSDWIEMHFSDFLENAPDDVIEDLSRIIFARMFGGEGDYSSTTLNYLTSDRFRDANLEKWVQRQENITDDDVTPLFRYYDELCAQGLLTPVPETESGGMLLRWAKDDGSAIHGSVLMRAATVNEKLMMYPSLINFAVYVAAAWNAIPFGVAPEDRHVMCRRIITDYPDSQELLENMHELGIEVNIA